MEPVLIKTQGEVEEMIINIDKDKKDAAETQTIVAAEEEAAQTKAAETKAIADDAQRDLDEALPALEEAVKCLEVIEEIDIDEVRAAGGLNFGKIRLASDESPSDAVCASVSEPRPSRGGLDTIAYMGRAGREIDDGGVLHHVQLSNPRWRRTRTVRCSVLVSLSWSVFRVEASRCSAMMSRVDGVRVASTPSPRGSHDRRHAIDACLRARRVPRDHLTFTGMGKIPNYFKSAQKELLSLGGKLIDKMKEYDKDNIPTKIIEKPSRDELWALAE